MALFNSAARHLAARARLGYGRPHARGCGRAVGGGPELAAPSCMSSDMRLPCDEDEEEEDEDEDDEPCCI